MPIISKKMQKTAKKAEQQRLKEEEAEKQRQEEEKKRIEEQKQREEQEKKDLRQQKKDKHKEKKLQAKREKEMREKMMKTSSEVQKISKVSGAKAIQDEQVFERLGYSVIRKDFTSGHYSKLYKAKKDENESLVVKIILLDGRVHTSYKLNLNKQSLKIMRYIGHGGEAKAPQFVRIYDIFAIQNKIYIFMDECQKVSLSYKIKSSSPISEENAKSWSKQVAEGISALHSFGISHRNIRPENVIFDKENNIKIVGLGMCCLYWDSVQQKVIPCDKEIADKNNLEKSNHLPPEALLSEYDPTLADVWGWGVLVCLLLTKVSPFTIKRKDNQFESMWQSYCSSHPISEQAKQTLDKVFVLDVSSRITIFEVLNEPWLQ